MSNISTCEYVIGVIHGKEIWYYSGEYDYAGKKLKPREQFSPFLVDAKHYEDRGLAEADLPLLHEMLTRKILEVRCCPKCGKNFTDYPAISRDDNKTEICPECGVYEAIVVFENSCHD